MVAVRGIHLRSRRTTTSIRSIARAVGGGARPRALPLLVVPASQRALYVSASGDFGVGVRPTA